MSKEIEKPKAGQPIADLFIPVGEVVDRANAWDKARVFPTGLGKFITDAKGNVGLQLTLPKADQLPVTPGTAGEYVLIVTVGEDGKGTLAWAGPSVDSCPET